MPKGVVIACAVFSTALVLASDAVAGEHPPPNPSIAQYVEVMPTSGGAVVPAGQTRAPLELRDIASSAEYGAPEQKLRASKRATVVARRAVIEPKADVSSTTFNAAFDAVGAQGRLVGWLGLVLFATLAFGIGAAVVRARS